MFFVGVKVVFGPPNALILFGIAIGALYGLIAVGIILIYRTNRIINFAAAAIGAVPGDLRRAASSVQQGHAVLASRSLITVIGGLALGALVDIVVIRRFRNAPRLILTVATIGVAQLLAFIAIYIPIWLGSERHRRRRCRRRGPSLRVDDVVGQPALSTATTSSPSSSCSRWPAGSPRSSATPAWASRCGPRPRTPTARSLLGIPVEAVQTVAWMIAGLFGAMTIFLRSPLVGVPGRRHARLPGAAVRASPPR